jgi:acetylornithine deacetylase/succinyl-diaminopimelate desuccinylase-like protein
LRALKTLIEKKALKVNIKYLIEGEEESGSTGLHGILQEKKEALKADYILIVDSGSEKKGVPAITLGARGLVTFTVHLKGSNFDLHSGTHGGIVYNPNHALVEMLASLHDAQGKVTIPHFYDKVLPLGAEEKKELALELDEENLASHFGAKPTGGEKAFSPLESAWLRPTLEINGLNGGYSGAGFKTVIPSKALAKLSCRLVPNQDPEEICRHLKAFLLSKAPPGITVEVEVMEGKGKAFRANPRSKLASTMSQAYSEVFDKPCTKIMIGGSIPIAVDLAQTSGGEMLLIGVALSEDQIHAPNEHFSLDRLEQGYLSICRGIQLLGQ